MVAYSFKKRFVVPIRIGLGMDAPAVGLTPKRQTVRAIGKRRHAQVGETLQLYQGMRTRDCFKIGEGICVDVLPILIRNRPSEFRVAVNGFPIKSDELEEFARNDGFDNAAEMHQFWQAEHPTIEDFDGIVIKWRPAA